MGKVLNGDYGTNNPQDIKPAGTPTTPEHIKAQAKRLEEV